MICQKFEADKVFKRRDGCRLYPIPLLWFKRLWITALILLFAGLSLPAGAGALRVSWDPPSAPDLDGFTISYGEQPGVHTESISITSPTTNEYQVNDLLVGHTYYFVVTAHDTSDNESDVSLEKYETVIPWNDVANTPTVDPDLVSLSNAEFNLSWNVANIPGAAKAGLEVSHVDGGFSNPNDTDWDPGSSFYSSTSLLNATSGIVTLDAGQLEGIGTYQLRIVALDAFNTIICRFSNTATLEVAAPQPDEVDPDTTTVTADPTDIPSDGYSTSLITVIPRNSDSNILGSGYHVVLSTTAGTLIGSVIDHGDGTYTQELLSTRAVGQAAVSAEVEGIAITMTANVRFGGIPEDLITGCGPGRGNPPHVRAFDPQTGLPIEQIDFMAYGTMKYGVNVASGDVNGDGRVDILTGPGPGTMFGPQVRVFNEDGATEQLDFMAYGTFKYGVKLAAGDIDGDHVHEIITAPGPGQVFGPHIRAWKCDNGSMETVTDVSFMAYGTYKYGANVTCGDIDGDGIDEIITGAGPGKVFGPHVRAWDYDGIDLQPISGVSFLAYGTNKYGVNVACGDIDGDGYDEIITGPGPGDMFGTHVRAWNYDNGTTPSGRVEAISDINFFAYSDLGEFGVNIASGDLDGDGYDEIVTAPGPGEADAFQAIIRAWNYDGEKLNQIESIDFKAYDAEYTCGAHVALGAVNSSAPVGRPPMTTGPVTDPLQSVR